MKKQKNNEPVFMLNSFFFFWFLGLHLWHMEVFQARGQFELQLPAYITAIATPCLQPCLQPTPQLTAMPDL